MRYKKADLLIELKTHNKDSLLRAAQTLAGILQKQIVYDSTCARKDKAVHLSIRETDGYKESHYYIRGEMTGEQLPKSQFGSFCCLPVNSKSILLFSQIKKQPLSSPLNDNTH